ncbi:MAG: TRAP transporter substrate-binding protein DctP [Deltaproteobacteria bacterium]|nr:TRAP transporter substrate-binding protein DctP [Deltaproteobacteria bacterium]
MARGKLRPLILLTLLVIGLVPASQALAEKRAVVWKVATLAPKNVGWGQQVQSLVVPWIRDSTNDELKLKIYWGGVMGNDNEYLQKMKIGQLQGAGISGAGANLACPELSVLGLPFLIRNYQEVDYLRTMMFATFDYYFDQRGYKMLMWMDQDFDQLYSTRFPMNTLEDFKRCRFQNWYGPLEAATVKALGGQPIVTTVIEGHSAFKSGVIDTAFAPAVYYAGSQLFQVMKYVNPLNIRYAPALIVITEKEWSALPEEYQDNLDSARGKVQAAFVKGIRDENKRALEGMIKYGIKHTEFAAETRAEAMRRTRPVWDQLAGKLYPRSLLEEVLKYLESFRAGKAIKTPRFKAGASTGAKPPVPVASPAAVQPVPAAKGGDSDTSELSAWEKRKIQVRKVQEKLAAMGYYKSDIDGVFGPITQEAILDYQEAKGLIESGAIDRRLLRSMGIAN